MNLETGMETLEQYRHTEKNLTLLVPREEIKSLLSSLHTPEHMSDYSCSRAPRQCFGNVSLDKNAAGSQPGPLQTEPPGPPTDGPHILWMQFWVVRSVLTTQPTPGLSFHYHTLFILTTFLSVKSNFCVLFKDLSLLSSPRLFVLNRELNI